MDVYCHVSPEGVLLVSISFPYLASRTTGVVGLSRWNRSVPSEVPLPLGSVFRLSRTTRMLVSDYYTTDTRGRPCQTYQAQDLGGGVLTRLQTVEIEYPLGYDSSETLEG